MPTAKGIWLKMILRLVEFYVEQHRKLYYRWLNEKQYILRIIPQKRKSPCIEPYQVSHIMGTRFNDFILNHKVLFWRRHVAWKNLNQY